MSIDVLRYFYSSKKKLYNDGNITFVQSTFIVVTVKMVAMMVQW